MDYGYGTHSNSGATWESFRLYSCSVNINSYLNFNHNHSKRGLLEIIETLTLIPFGIIDKPSIFSRKKTTMNFIYNFFFNQ